MTENNTPAFAELSNNDIVERLRGAKNLLIIPHTNPDGDALGSAAGLCHLATALGVKAKCGLPDKPADRLLFLLDSVDWSIITPEDARDFDTVCTVDVASPEQLGALSSLAEEGKIHFMIDHHAEGTPFADGLIDSKAAAAGEIVFSLYSDARHRYGLPVLPELCRPVYCAIVADTGSFKFSNVTPKTHMVAAELHSEINTAEDGGPTTDELCRTLFGRRTLKDLHAQALAINKLQLHCEGKLGVVMITRDDLLENDLEEADTSAAVETPRSLEGVKVALSVRQTIADEKLYKVSSRSNCDVSVSAICATFGGGGHDKAAGCRVIADSPEEALEKLVAAFGRDL